MYVDGHTVLCSSGHGPSPVPGHPPPRRPMSQSVRQLPCSVPTYCHLGDVCEFNLSTQFECVPVVLDLLEITILEFQKGSVMKNWLS